MTFHVMGAYTVRGYAEGPRRSGGLPMTLRQPQMALTSSGMPGPNVVDTAPFWM